MSFSPSLLSTLLFQEIKSPKRGTGRIIKFSEGELDIEFATGAMHERVIALLSKNQEPMTASEIARGIGSNASRVSATLKRLQKECLIECIHIEGCIREYLLKN